MPDLLIELFSEEIPARMQRQAAEDLKGLVTNALVDAELHYEGAQAFVTPRRLALHVVGLPSKQHDYSEEKRGPRVGAPSAAIQGFLKAAGLTDIEDALVVDDAKKGRFYVARVHKTGRLIQDIAAEIIPAIIRSFPWPKSMRWGAASIRPDSLRWVRPLRGIVCTLATQHDAAEIISFEIDGIHAGDVTWGHRFMAPAPIHVRRFDDYVDALHKAKVVLDADRRKAIILADAKDLAFAQGLTLIEDEGLLEEVAGLVEWPVVLMGEFESAFLDLPPEVIRATIRANQKCFVLREPLTSPSVIAGLEPANHEAPQGAQAGPSVGRNGVDGRDNPRIKSGDGHDDRGKLANKFILVSNLVAPDGGAAIAAGNARVVRARLADARHFWQTDLAPLLDAKDKRLKPLDQRLMKLERVVFHEKLGTQGERIARIEALARELAPRVGADAELAARAAKLAKADLATEMVGEFPELQGLMGRYYATAQGEEASVADAIEDHYKPQGPNDRIPTSPVSIAVALADKLDTLVGFWAIDEKPTGSKDPFALRRAALGCIAIILENRLRLPLIEAIRKAVNVAATKDIDLIEKIASFEGSPSEEREFFAFHGVPFMRSFSGQTGVTTGTSGHPSFFKFVWFYPELFEKVFSTYPILSRNYRPPERDRDLLAFFADRLKIYLRDKGARHDLIDAVFALPGQDDLLMIVRRVEALGKLLDSEDGKNLLVGYRRAANILRAEEKKDGADAFAGKHVHTALSPPAEIYLSDAVASAGVATRERVASEDFEGAMRALATLRAPVDAFFLDVTVNDPDPETRLNRLRLLGELREAMHAVADFSKVAG